MSKLIVILGAGFSIPAGFPSGNLLNQKFFKGLENKMLRMSSGEWTWDEYDSASSNNGRLNYDYLNISYLLSEFVEKHQTKTYRIFNYEEFYDWFIENFNNKLLIDELAEKVNRRLKSEFNIDHSSNHILKNPGSNEYRKMFESFNYLIGDLLGRSYRQEEEGDHYNPFIDYLISADNDDVEIFSLNHDILLEYLLNQRDVKFSDGFSTENSCIVGENNEPLPCFQNLFTEKIKLYKIHGSLNYYRFEELIRDGVINRNTGKYWFFKPGTYQNKHYAKRIDPQTKKVVQDFNWNTVPQFLTGKNKKEYFKDQHFYKEIYSHFRASFVNCDRAIIIGYSYADTHVNEIIKNAIDIDDFNVININPGIEFPFRRDYTAKNISNYSTISKAIFT